MRARSPELRIICTRGEGEPRATFSESFFAVVYDFRRITASNQAVAKPYQRQLTLSALAGPSGLLGQR